MINTRTALLFFIVLCIPTYILLGQPTLVSSWPTNGSANVPTNSNITLQFSEPIQDSDGNGTWDDDVFAESGDDCFDMEITEADFPFSHLADLTTEDDDWDQSTFPFPGGGEHSNGANGSDYTYKLTLSQPAIIYVTTCDALTNVDVQIGIYTDDCSDASWIFFQDDSNSPIYYPDQTTEQYEFQCISGFESAPQYANMLPRIVWDAGTYYIVVDDRAGIPGTGTVKTWMGYSLLVDSTEVAGDFSGVDYFFSEGVYGGDYADVYNGNGIGLETSDYNLDVNPNGGDANQVNLTSLEASNGASLTGGEEIVVLNLEYPITPSGGEILTVGPASVSSIFNSVGVPLLDIDGITINLVDEVAPTIEFTSPVNGQTGVPSGDNITIRFSEKIRNSLDESNITNSNATECFKLEEAISGDDLTFTIISPDQIEFIINPDGQLPEYTEIKLSILATLEDQNNNGFQFDTLRFLTLGINTYVPDNNFEQALIDLGYDDTLDDSVLTENISSLTSLDVNNKQISDLTGIEDFTALNLLDARINQLTSLDVSNNTVLEILSCSYNQLTSLDVSANTALFDLLCRDNQLTSLDVSNNTSLNFIACSNNQLTSLDVSNNTALDTLNCGNNQLTSLDVSANTALNELHCYSNQLTSLDVSSNTSLTYLHCRNNQLTSLDLSTNTALTYLSSSVNQLTSLDLSNSPALITLSCYSNQLTSLDLSANTALDTLSCHSNQLTSLDLSSNTALTYLQCEGNQLSYLSMKNGITDALTNFNATDNSLICIEVNAEDIDYATENWTYENGNIDAGVMFLAVCELDAPVITNVVLNPPSPTAQGNVNVTADLSDETGIDVATLYYQEGGSSGYTSVAMTGSAGSYTGTIPGFAVTMNGFLYYITAQDPLGSSTISDTLSSTVRFTSGSLSTGSTNSSAYPSGLPMEKWRLISIPAVLDENSVWLVIGDELGTQDDQVWKLFEYNEGTGVYITPANFTLGSSYWLIQRVGDNLSVATPAGATGDMSGTTLNIKPGWNLIGFPYPFSVYLDLDQTQFYGPITYGVAAEEWSPVVTELDPWNGYAVYNRTSSDQTITLDPTASSGGSLARTIDEEEGWLMTLQVRADEYQDRFNTIGALLSAHDDRDWHDNPEITAPGKSVSLSFKIPDEDATHEVTSDVRSLDEHLKSWDARIRNTDLESALTVSWHSEQALPVGHTVQLVDLNTRTVVDMVLKDHLELGLVDSRYDRQIKIVAGNPEQVALAVDDILATIPEELSLDGNYPNPFNPVTTIRFGLPEPRNVRITVVNILGQEITELVKGWRDIGRHEVIWQGVDGSGKAVASGMYFTVMSDGNKIIVQKMLLLK